MKRMLWKAVSLLCALSIAAVTMGLAYQSAEEVEPTMAELEEMASSIAEIYETEPIENPDEIEFLDMSTEEMVEASSEYGAAQQKQAASGSEEQTDVVEQHAAAESLYSVETSVAGQFTDGPDQYSTAPLEDDTSLFSIQSSDTEESSEEESDADNSLGEASDEQSTISTQSGEPSQDASASQPGSSQAPVSSQAPSPSQQPSSSSSSSSSSSGGGDYTGETVIVIYNGAQVKMSAKEVLPIFVAYEMSASWSSEALKAQAVASHTYIKYYNDVYKKAVTVPTLTGNKAIEAKDSRIIQACNAVSEQMVYYNGKVIDAQYCAAMSSMSRNASDVYQSGSYAYLTSVESKYESYGPNWNKKVYISVSDFKSMVEKKWGSSALGLSSISPQNWIQIVNHTADGYVNKVKIGKYETTGWYLYLATGGKTRSAWFTVQYDSLNQQFVFTTQGHGHCVGMSQYGALYYAMYGGWSYKQILTHYYKGTTVG